MVSLSANVIGRRELQRDLKNIVRSIGPPEAAEVMLAGAEVIADGVRMHIRQQGLVDSGDLLGSVSAYKINQFAAGVRVSEIYAAVHEYGHVFGEDSPFTARMRRFFWAMWHETQDDMWKYMALSDTIEIPARPYFRPAVDEFKSRAVDAIADELRDRIERAV